MIFQSRIPTTSKESNQQGLIYMSIGAALILLISLLVKFPMPEKETPEAEYLFLSFGNSETGGPAAENGGGDGGGEESVSPQNTPSTENNSNAQADPGKDDAPAINDNKSNNKTSNTTQNQKQPEKGSGFSKNKKKGNGPIGDGDGKLPGGGGTDTENKGSPDGRYDGDGTLKAGYRPRKVREFSFQNKESDIGEKRILKVTVTVSCAGIVRDVKIAKGSTSSDDLIFVKETLKGKKYFDARPNCEGDARWEEVVTILP